MDDDEKDDENKKKIERIEALGKKWNDTKSAVGSDNNGDGEHNAEACEEVDEEQEKRMKGKRYLGRHYRSGDDRTQELH